MHLLGSCETHPLKATSKKNIFNFKLSLPVFETQYITAQIKGMSRELFRGFCLSDSVICLSLNFCTPNLPYSSSLDSQKKGIAFGFIVSRKNWRHKHMKSGRLFCSVMCSTNRFPCRERRSAWLSLTRYIPEIVLASWSDVTLSWSSKKAERYCSGILSHKWSLFSVKQVRILSLNYFDLSWGRFLE